jgi:hypothetical protein
MDGELFYKAYTSKASHIGGYWKDGLPVEFTQEQIEELKKLSEDEQEAYALKLKGE